MPCVGQAVGEQETTAQLVVGQVQAHLLAAAEPSSAEIGAAARLEGFHRPLGRSARLGRGLRRGHEHVDRRVVGHHAEAILGAQGLDGAQHRRPRHLDLAARHRSGAVDHQAKVHRHARRSRGRFGCPQIDAHVALARRLGTDQVPVGLGLEVHVSPLGLLLEDPACLLEEPFEATVRVARERAADVQLEVFGQRDALPLRALARLVDGGREARLLDSPATGQRGSTASGSRRPTWRRAGIGPVVGASRGAPITSRT